MAKFCGKGDDGCVGIVFTAEEWEAISCLINYSADKGNKYHSLPLFPDYESRVQDVYDILQESDLFGYDYERST